MAKSQKRKTKKKLIVKEKPPLTDAQKVAYFDTLSSTLENYTPWLWEGSMWKTESAYWTWVRGQFRGIWGSWAPKNDYLRKRAIQVEKLDVDGKRQHYKTGSKKGKVVTVKGYECEATGKLVKASSPKGVRGTPYNVDHIDEAGALTNGFEACIYLFRLLCSQDNMQILDTEYHKILTYSSKHNLSIEEATAEKAVIAKLKQTVAKQKAELKKAGYKPKDTSNADKRRVCYRELLK